MGGGGSESKFEQLMVNMLDERDKLLEQLQVRALVELPPVMAVLVAPVRTGVGIVVLDGDNFGYSYDILIGNWMRLYW